MAGSRGPKVSVVIPCYNYAQHLPDAVCSVIAQTCTDWELIIVNDGSEDDTVAVAERLIREFSYLPMPISLVDKPNGGVSDARNAGIGASRGAYVLPLDADDVIADTMLEKTLAVLEECPDVGIAYTDLYAFEPGLPHAVVQFPEYRFDLLCRKQILFYCSLFRRHVWEEVGGFDTALPAMEDWEFWISCGERGFQARRIPEPLFGVRHKPSGLHTQVLERDLELRARIALKHRALFNPVTLAWAEAILARDEARGDCAPDEILARGEILESLSQAYLALDHRNAALSREVGELRARLGIGVQSEGEAPAWSRTLRTWLLGLRT
jgi:glycosyltransferase involved in cell wall biosynthesis